MCVCGTLIHECPAMVTWGERRAEQAGTTAASMTLDVLPPKPSYMESIATPRRARKDRRCDSCGEDIPAGSLYVHHSLPPGSDIGNTTWQTLNTCGWWTSDCRRYWVIDSRDLNGEPHVLPL